MENKDQNSAVPNGQTLGEPSSLSSELSDGGVVKEPPLDTNALSLEPGVPEPLTSQEQPKRQSNPFLRFVRRADVLLIAVLVLGAIGFFFTTTHNKNRGNEVNNQTASDRFGTVKIPLGDLVDGKNLSLAGVANVTINGSIQVNDSFVLSPSLQPTGAKAGQIYYDQGTNQLAYFNGSNFVFLTSAAPSAGGVQSLGGATGLLTLGSGLSTSGNQITNSGVLSVQGQNGPVTFTAGPGIVINGTNFSNSGIISVSSDDPNITVTNDGQGNVKLSVAAAGTGTVTSGGGSAGYIPVFTASQNIENSVITQSGLTVTITGDLSVVTGGLTLSNALSVPNGGTGATSFAANGVLVGHGTAAITSVSSGGAGLCLLSTAGAPTWAACPSGSGVTSVNSLTGGLNIANASGSGTTITIDDASTTNKGIASFNGTNFSVAGGAVNTIQDINSSATPTFAGVNTNNITPSAALTVGVSGQTALLQGSTTTITSNGVGNNIVLNSAGTIELQDNTNVTGSITTSGTLAVNGGSITSTGALAVTPGGALTVGASSQTLTLQGGAATSFRATSGANTTVVAFTNPVANTTLNFPALSAGTYTICTTSGNCAGAGVTLQAAYDNSTSPEIVLDATRGALTIRDNATPVSGNLLEVQNNTGSATYLAVTSSGVAVSGTAAVSGNINSSTGALQTNGTSRIDSAGNAVNIGSLTLSGAISGGTTFTGSGNINSTAGSLQTNSTTRIDNSGNLVNIAALTASGSASFQGGNVTLGTNAQAGTITLNDGSLNIGTLQVAALGQDTVYILPDPGAGTATICLTTGNCAGTGGGVTTGGGTTNKLAKFTGTQAIGDSSITDDATNVTVSVDVIVQGGDLTLGTSSQPASMILHDGNGQTTTLQAGDSTGNITFILPTNTGTANQCLKQSGTGNQLVWQDCDGGSGGSSATLQTAYNNSTSPEIVLNSSVGGLTLRDNSTPLGTNLFEIQNNAGSTTYLAVTVSGVSVTGTATASGDINSTGGSLQTNSTTRIDNSGNLTNIGNITGTGAITIASIGAGNDITVDGADQFIVQDASVFNALSTFNANIDLGSNDLVGTTGNINLTNFDVAGATGNVTAGTYNGQTISNAANFTGSITAAGNLTLTAGDVAVNGGDITSSGALNITPGGTLTVGVTGQQLILQGSANTQLTATGGGFTTSVGFAGVPAASVTYNFDRTASAGIYTICTTIGNCAGTGGGVTTSGGTTGTIAKFTGSQTLGDSLLSESGSVVTVNGNLNLVSGNQFTVNGTQISSANLSNDANLAKLSSSQTFTGNAIAFQNGTNSTNAFNIQNAAGNRIVTVDTTNGNVVLGTASALDGTLVFQNMTNANTVTVLPGTPTANRTITLPDASGVICTDSGNCAGAGATLQTAYNFSVGGTTPKIKLNSTLVGFDIQDADTTIGANLFNVRASNGAGLGSVIFGVGNTGQVTLQNSANSTAALRLLTSGGTNVLTGDTTNGQIILGQSSTLNGTLVFNNSANSNSVTLSSAAATASRNILLPDSSGTICLTSGNCSGSGSSNTLQAAYDAGNTISATTGRDVLITLADLATDPNFIVNLQCDTACGANGRFALQDDGVDTFTVSPAGGAVTIQPTTDTTTAFNMKTSLGNNIFTIDSLNSRLGFNLGTSTLPNLSGSAGFELKGALRLSGASNSYADSYSTPLGSSISTMVNVSNYTVPAFGQVIALGTPAASDATSRVLTILDARTVTHQPSIAVLSPNENEIAGLSWDGSSTAFRVKNSASGSIALNVFGTDRLTASTTGVTINGAIDQSGGAITMVGNNTSSISTTSGSLTLQSVSGANNIVINGSANTMTLNTGASGTITVGSSNTTTVNVGAQTNNARTINVGYASSTQAQTVNIGAPASTGVTSIYSGSGGTILTSTGSTVVKQSGTATTTAFQVQNVAGTQTYFNVDALNGRAGVGTASPNAQLDVVGYIPSAATASVAASNLVYNVVTAGKYAYSANFAALQVWDITRPSAPVSVATASTTNNGVSFVRVYGRYAVNVVTTWDSIDIFDISNPSAPNKLKNMTVTSTDDVAINGRYMYIGTSDGSSNLFVYDIINPSNPVLVGTFSQTRPISEMFIQGRYMYATRTDGFNHDLAVYDLTNPASPSLAGSVTSSVYGRLKVAGRYAYAASGTTIQAFNVANPASPASVGTLTVSGSVTDISVQGRYAYVSADNTTNVINVVNISNPASMTSVGTIATGTYIRGLALQGRYLYGADYGNSALKVYDIGGTYTQGLEAGSVTASNIDVSGGLKVAGDVQLTSGARVDGNVDINGTLGLNGTQSIQTTTNSANAFQIQNSSAINIMNVSTIHNTSDLVTNGSLETNTTGWAARGSSTISRTTSEKYVGSASLQVVTTAAANDGAKYPLTLTASTTYTASFYIKLSSGTFTTLNYGYSSDGSTETDCKTGQQSKTGGWMIMNCTFTTAASVTGSPYFYMKQTDATARTFYIDAFQLVPGSDIGAYYEGKINTGGTIFSGPVAIQNDNNSQSVFQVQDSVGTTLFGVDAVNYRVGIGLIKAQATLDVVSVVTNNVALSVTQNASSTQDILRLTKSGSTDVLDIAHTGATTFQNNTNSATAFRILDSAGTTTVLDVDTTNKRVGIGNNAPTRSLDISISTTSTNTLPLLLQQSSTGDTGLELKTATQNFYVGVDNTDGQFKIASAASANGSTNMGNTAVGTGTDSNINGAQALKVTATTTGSVSSVSVYIDSLDSTPANRLIQVGVYSDNGSGTSPNALLGSSSGQTAVVGWNTIPVSGVTVTNGTVYWVAMAENGGNLFRHGTGGTTAYHVTTGYPLPNPYAANSGNSTDNPSFYMTVTNNGSADNFNGTNMFTLSDTGAANFKNATDSTGAFRVLNASGTSVFTVDTTNARAYIGDPTADATGALLVLDVKNTTGDPTGVNGAMYYNSALHEYRCFRGVSSTEADGAWAPCASNPIDRGFEVNDEFLGGSTADGDIGDLGWWTNNNGTPGVTYNAGFPVNNNRPGEIEINTSTTSGNGMTLTLNGGNSNSTLIASGNVMKAGVGFDSTLGNLVSRIGLHSETTSNARPVSGVWWEAAPTVNARWQFCYGNGTTATCSNATNTTPTIVATTWYRLEIRVTATGSGTSSAEFYIDGAKYTVSNVTIDTTNGVNPAIACFTSTAAERYCDVDYYQFRGTSSTGR